MFEVSQTMKMYIVTLSLSLDIFSHFFVMLENVLLFGAFGISHTISIAISQQKSIQFKKKSIKRAVKNLKKKCVIVKN